jgi:hypothetical protein
MPAEVTYTGYMGKRGEAAKTPCAKCGTPCDPGNMIKVTRARTPAIPGDVRTALPQPESLCLPCYWAPAHAAANAKRPAAPAIVPAVRAEFGSTVWATSDEAAERRAKVMLYLGVDADIQPRDPGLPGPRTVSPDGPLVPFAKTDKPVSRSW